MAADSMKHSAGYSTKSLAAKLGIGGDTTVLVIGAPRHYAALLGPLPPGARIVKRPPKQPSFVHVFSISGVELASQLARLRKTIAQNGVVWVSWPKKASGVSSDLDENTVRGLALPLGFVDVKVCAVDEVWSGLKLVIRHELRARR